MTVAAGAVSRAQLPAIAAMLARAFHDDPAYTYIIPDPERRARGLRRLFAIMLASDTRAGFAVATNGGEAVTSWRAPGRACIGPVEMLGQGLPLLAALGTGLPRALRLAAAIEARFPAEPFWYLHIAGCDPARQGQGFGAAAVRAGIRRAAWAWPTYLETATEKNVAFYTGLGFHVTAEWSVPGTGLRFWSLRRNPDEAGWTQTTS